MNHRISSGLLGAADGTTSIAGVIAGGAASHLVNAKIAVVALGGAAAATISMAGAEMLSEGETDWGAIGAMGAGTFAGSAIPAVPLLGARGSIAWALVVAFSALLAWAVGEVRACTLQRPRVIAYAQTLAVLTLGAGVGYAAGLA